MEAASFTAWQILAISKGYKKDWAAYRKGMGLDTKQHKRDYTEENEQAIESAKALHEKFGNGATHGRT